MFEKLRKKKNTCDLQSYFLKETVALAANKIHARNYFAVKGEDFFSGWEFPCLSRHVLLSSRYKKS